MITDKNNLNSLLDHKITKEYQRDIANRFIAFEGLEISSVYDICVKIRDSIRASAEEKVGIFQTYKNKLWFDQEWSELVNKRKQTKLVWLQNPNNQAAEDLTNIMRDNCRTTKKTKRDYMKAKVNKLEENGKNKTFREMCKEINEFEKVYQPPAYVIKKDDGKIVADTTSILNKREKFYCSLIDWLIDKYAAC